MQGWQKTSELSEATRKWINTFLNNYPTLKFYYHAAIEDLNKGVDNRCYLIGQQKAGLVNRIFFDDATISTTAGTLTSSEIKMLLDDPNDGELHVSEDQAIMLKEMAGARVLRTRELLYYQLLDASHLHADENCRLLNSQEFEKARSFYEVNYPGTIFSKWMLEMPFFALLLDDTFVACGGTIAISERMKACHIGNFLTPPQHRGKGYAKRIAATLSRHLFDAGITNIMLGTTKDNVAARSVYETLGFRMIDRRVQLDLAKSS